MPNTQPRHFDYVSVVRVIDGDTFEGFIDTGFYQYTRERFRFRDYNAPELHSSDPRERAMGLAAYQHLKSIVEGRQIQIDSWKEDSFRRWLSDVTLIGPAYDTFDLVTQLTTGGWGVRWDGKGKIPRPWLTEWPRYPYPESERP